jgi:hypothetical protein
MKNLMRKKFKLMIFPNIFYKVNTLISHKFNLKLLILAKTNKNNY